MGSRGVGRWGHLIIEPNVWVNPKNGFRYCLACKKADWYWKTHEEGWRDYRAIADGFYRELMEYKESG